MKSLVITGCFGFIGSHVTRLCLLRGYRVYGIDKLTYASVGMKSEIAQEILNNRNFTFEQTDIADLKRLPDCDYVINIAAESHVGNSIINCSDFVHSNIDGVRNLLTLIEKKPNNVRKRPILMQFSCYDEETKALTKDGLKRYDEIREGDIVYSFNTQTGETEEKRVEKVIIQNYSGDMIHFNKNNEDLLVTPNHRMYCYHDKKEEYFVDRADIVCDKYGLKHIRPNNKKGKVEETYYIEGIGEVPIKELFYISGIFIGDGFTAYQEKKVPNKTGWSRQELREIMATLNKKEGRVRKLKPSERGPRKFSVSKSFRIYLDIPEKDICRDRVGKSLDALGIKWTYPKNKSGQHFYFSSEHWLNYFKQFGKYAENKTIPEWMLEYDSSILKYLFDGIVDSDGSWYKNNKYDSCTVTTVSSNLKQQVLKLGVFLGYFVRFSENPPVSSFSKKDGRMIRGNHDCYRIYFTRQNKGVGGYKYERIKYDGKIWCVKVEDNKNLLVERNGRLLFSGNTDEVYGDIENGSFNEESRLNPSNPYAVSKAAADMLIKSWHRTYGIDYIIVRPTNNYGKYQYPEKLVPLCVKLLMDSHKIRLHDEGKPIRTWLHVEDTADAILCLLRKGEVNNIYNIGGKEELENIEVATMIVNSFLKKKGVKLSEELATKHFDLDYKREGQDVRYSVDDSKLRELGWQPTRSFGEEISDIVEHYKNNYRW